jgi:hypothetical protein
LTPKNESSERVKLDEILKSLFNVSNKVLITMMNSLFQETFDIETTEVSFASNEFVDDEYNVLRGDLFLRLREEEKAHHYHIELQTLNDDRMVIRMLEYGINKAKEIAKYEGEEDETVFYIPKQLVIFIEENPGIKDELKLRLIFPDGQEVKYIVPVMKYWEYSKEDILEQKLYPLLPLQVFKLRYQMEKIKNRKTHTEEKLRKLIKEAQQIVESISNEAARLFKVQEIDGEDLHKILLANAELFRYLNSRYVKDEKLNKEVLSMTKTLYDPAVEEKGRREGKLEGKLEAARNALIEGIEPKIVAKITGLSMETVEKLKKELVN